MCSCSSATLCTTAAGQANFSWAQLSLPALSPIRLSPPTHARTHTHTHTHSLSSGALRPYAKQSLKYLRSPARRGSHCRSHNVPRRQRRMCSGAQSKTRCTRLGLGHRTTGPGLQVVRLVVLARGHHTYCSFSAVFCAAGGGHQPPTSVRLGGKPQISSKIEHLHLYIRIRDIFIDICMRFAREQTPMDARSTTWTQRRAFIPPVCSNQNAVRKTSTHLRCRPPNAREAVGLKGQVWTRYLAPAAPAFTWPSLPWGGGGGKPSGLIDAAAQTCPGALRAQQVPFGHQHSHPSH